MVQTKRNTAFFERENMADVVNCQQLWNLGSIIPLFFVLLLQNKEYKINLKEICQYHTVGKLYSG